MHNMDLARIHFNLNEKQRNNKASLYVCEIKLSKINRLIFLHFKF